MKTKIYDALERPHVFSPSKKNVTLKRMLVTPQCIRTFYEILTMLERKSTSRLFMELKIIVCANVIL